MSRVVDFGFVARLTSSLLEYRGPHRPEFVHCFGCRWPVNPGRTTMGFSLGGEMIPATEAQMQRVCEGLKRMGA